MLIAKQIITDKAPLMQDRTSKNLMIRLHHQFHSSTLREKVGFPKIDQNLYNQIVISTTKLREAKSKQIK